MIRAPFWMVTLMLCSSLYGQKPVIDTALTGIVWPSVEEGILSPDGRYAAYTVMNNPAGGCTTVIREVKGRWKKEIKGVRDAHMTSDSHWVLLQGGDSLVVQWLGGDDRVVLKDVRSYQLVGKGGVERLVYLRNTPAGELVVRDLSYGKEIQYPGVKQYSIGEQSTGMLLRRTSKSDTAFGDSLYWLDFSTGLERKIWEGGQVHDWVIAKGEGGLTFLATTKNGAGTDGELWYYRPRAVKAIKLAYDGQPGIDTTLILKRDVRPVFGRGADRIFFCLTRRPRILPPATGVQVDIWHYKDLVLQSEQLMHLGEAKSYWAVVPVGGGPVIQLQKENEQIFFQQEGVPGELAIVSISTDSMAWQRGSRSYSLYAVSTDDGRRRLIGEQVPCQPFEHEFRFSPAGRQVLWFNRCQKNWYSYDWQKETLRWINDSIAYPMYNENCYEFAGLYPYQYVEAVGVGGWLEGGRKVLLYDDYDIWEVALEGNTPPVCVTKGYGRRHHVKLRIAWDNDHRGDDEGLRILREGDGVLLSGFDSQTMDNGFYGLCLSGRDTPMTYTMQPALLYAEASQLDKGSPSVSLFLQRSKSANAWLLRRESELENPNYYITSDFVNFWPLSDVQPQRSCNWMTAELLHWKTLSGQDARGILYKPENFDPKKYYPVLFNYYEQQSSGLHHFPRPELCRDNINIAYFVSRGYLVCIPDIRYQIGHPGKSAADAVVSAAMFLSHHSHTDGLHMGIQGHGFGGFETNYLATHTHLFAAAAESAGESDIISAYGGLSYGLKGNGISMHDYYEKGQGRMGATLWEQPELYKENSAVLSADKATIPLLMMHNKKDSIVPFMQGVELFTSFQRLGKPVWMLQYDNEGHGLLGEQACRDYTHRLLQFFDHYLKGAPAPVWMTKGIPAKYKGRIDGFKLDK